VTIDAIAAVRTRVCPVCGSSDDHDVVLESTVDASRLTELSFASRKPPEYMHHRYVRCPVCRVVYVTPAPCESAVLDAYDDAGFDAGVESRLAARTYVEALDRVLPRVSGRAALVDIGAGDGAFLAAAAGRGFHERVGFEPSLAPIEAAPPDARPLLRHEPFRDGVLAPHSASVVTCLQTIEHVDDPLALCRSAARLLHPGGVLMLICHNAAAFSARLMGGRSPIYDVEHLQLFDRTSIRALLSQAGLTDVTVSSLSNAYPVSYWVRLAPLPVKERIQALLQRSSLGDRLLRLPAGNMLAVGVRPPI
jgi:SAM-dependent methyltransferase